MKTGLGQGRFALQEAPRSSLYYRPREASGENLVLTEDMDRQYLDTPFYRSRRMKVWLAREGRYVSRKRAQPPWCASWGLRAIYRQPRTSQPAPERRVYPYLLRDLTITRPNQVWAADITYLPMARGFLYLVAIMDWHNRYVMAWRLSNTLETGFCEVDPGFGQLVKSRLTRLPGVSGGQLSILPRNCRPCVPPSVVEGMNHGTDARIPHGSGASSR